MKITGKNLVFVRGAIDLAIAEVHNQIATCPDVFEYEEDLDELNKDKERLEKFVARIDKAIAKEQS